MNGKFASVTRYRQIVSCETNASPGQWSYSRYSAIATAGRNHRIPGDPHALGRPEMSKCVGIRSGSRSGSIQRRIGDPVKNAQQP